MAKHYYRRTAALLGAQPTVARQQKARSVGGTVTIPWRLLLPVVGVVATLLWLWLDPAWYVAATRIRVVGATDFETRREVALAGQVLGLHGLWLRPSTIISEVLAAVPVVEQVQIAYQVYPAGCTLTVKEREPVLLWVTPEGSVWVDAEGVVMPVRDARAELPVVHGPLPEGEKVPQAVLDSVAALRALALPEGALGYHPQRGLLWSSPEGPVVAFGLGTEMLPRWQLYTRLLESLRAQGIMPRAIDVRFMQAPVYTLTDEW